MEYHLIQPLTSIDLRADRRGEMEKRHVVITMVALFLLHLVVSSTPINAQSVKKTESPENPPQSLSGTLQKRTLAFTISVEAVFHKLREKHPPILIDVRSKDQFEGVNIPGSINIPLYAIKTKTYLTSTPLILINEGYTYEPLGRECAHLRKAGFQVWIINGGLYYWKQRGGPLHGDPFKQRELNRVPPPIFFTEKEYEDWLIIDISASKKSKASSLIPRSIHIPCSDNRALFAAALKKTIAHHKSNPLLSVLLFNERGEGYEAIEETVQKAGCGEVFFLQGGLEAYNRFVTNLTLIRQARENSKKTIKKCINCP